MDEEDFGCNDSMANIICRKCWGMIEKHCTCKLPNWNLCLCESPSPIGGIDKDGNPIFPTDLS